MSSENKTWSFAKTLEEVIAYPNLREPKPPTLWPSSATSTRVADNGEEVVGGACRRATAISYIKRLRSFMPDKLSDFHHIILKDIDAIPVERSMELRRMGELGNVFEDWLINDTKRSGLYYDDQCPVYYHEARFSGKVDICLFRPETNKYVLAEVKSISPYWVDQCIGTSWMINNHKEAKPRIKHLLQIAFYHWHKTTSSPDSYEHSKLIYVGRAHGEMGEYNVDVRPGDDGKEYIWYQQVAPHTFQWRNSGYTMGSMMDSAKMILSTVKGGGLPPRDYDWILTEETIDKMYKNGELPAGQATKHEKRRGQIEYNNSVEPTNKLRTEEYERAIEAYNGDSVNNPRPKKPTMLKPKRVNKRIERFNKVCSLCDYKTFCFNEQGEPLAD